MHLGKPENEATPWPGMKSHLRASHRLSTVPSVTTHSLTQQVGAQDGYLTYKLEHGPA